MNPLDLPDDPAPTPNPTAGALLEIATWSHELFLSLMTTGFTEAQALVLTGTMVNQMIAGSLNK